MRWVVLFFALALVGCGKKDSVPAGDSGESGWGGSQQANISQLPQTLNERYQGRNAQEWGKELLDGNERVSQAAGFALRELGPEALRFGLAGFDSRHVHVRYNSLTLAVHSDYALKYPKVFIPPLVRLLSDDNPGVRQAAANLLAFCDFKDSIATLREALGRETNTQTRQHMLDDLDKLENGPLPANYYERVVLNRTKPKSDESAEVKLIPAVREKNPESGPKPITTIWQLKADAIPGSINEGDTITDREGVVWVISHKYSALVRGNYRLGTVRK
jgi:hypothetical protein